MSAENVRSFLSQANQNEEIRQGLASKQSFGEIVAFASQYGYEFSAAEFETASAEYMEQHGNELTEEQLEAVSGGYCSSVIIINCSCAEAQ
jgi:predicted ribosomally synthesized peptide with nif11-like leader